MTGQILILKREQTRVNWKTICIINIWEKLFVFHFFLFSLRCCYSIFLLKETNNFLLNSIQYIMEGIFIVQLFSDVMADVQLKGNWWFFIEFFLLTSFFLLVIWELMWALQVWKPIKSIYFQFTYSENLQPLCSQLIW